MPKANIIKYEQIRAYPEPLNDDPSSSTSDVYKIPSLVLETPDGKYQLGHQQAARLYRDIRAYLRGYAYIIR
jgi:hypothetical protein